MIVFEEHHVPVSHCPCCGIVLDAASGMGEGGPSPGDISVCLGCATPLRFNHDMSVRVLAQEDYDTLEADVLMDMHKMQTVIHGMITKREGKK